LQRFSLIGAADERAPPAPPLSSTPAGGRGGPGVARDGEGALQRFSPIGAADERAPPAPLPVVYAMLPRTSRARPSTPSPSRASPDPPPGRAARLARPSDPPARGRGTASSASRPPYEARARSSRDGEGVFQRFSPSERRTNERYRRRLFPLPPQGGSEGRARPVARPWWTGRSPGRSGGLAALQFTGAADERAPPSTRLSSNPMLPRTSRARPSTPSPSRASPDPPPGRAARLARPSDPPARGRGTAAPPPSPSPTPA
jgi:hypothetical protein